MKISGGSVNLYQFQPGERARREPGAAGSGLAREVLEFDASTPGRDANSEETAQGQLPAARRVGAADPGAGSRFARIASAEEFSVRERSALQAYLSVELNTVRSPDEGELVGIDIFV